MSRETLKSGDEFEQKIAMNLRLSNFIIFTNLSLAVGNRGRPYEADITIIIGLDIIVVEVKNYHRLIGDFTKKDWFYLDVWNRRMQRKNPVNQNREHIQRLSWLINQHKFKDAKMINYYNCVVVPTECIINSDCLGKFIFHENDFYTLMNELKSSALDNQCNELIQIINNMHMAQNARNIHRKP